MFRAGGVVVVASLCACSAPVRRGAPPPPAPPDAAVAIDAPADAALTLVTEADYDLPVAGAVVNECRPVRATKPLVKTPDRKRKIYDFSPIKVRPVRHGPTLAERPYIGHDHSFEDARGVFASRSSEVTACWRWASARGAKETTLAVALTLDPRGSTSDVTISSGQVGDDELIACVKDMLRPPSWGAPRARPLRVNTFLAFNNDMPPKGTPKRPKAPKVTKPKQRPVDCPPADAQAQEEVYLPTLVVTNFDETGLKSDDLVPARRTACDRRTREIDKASIRIGLRSQQGAFDTCYADAVTRTPSLVGDLGAKLVLDSNGYARNVEVAGAGDDVLHKCLASSLEALWVAPYFMAMEIEVNLAFTLTQTREASADPHVLIEAGETETALATLVEVLRAPHTPLHGCLAHAEILYGLTFVAPWLDDDRIKTGIANLVRSALALPPAEARSCIAKAQALLQTYVRLQGTLDSIREPPPREDIALRRLERYEAVLPLADLLPNGAKLRWYHAFYLLRTDRHSEAEDTFAELATHPVIGDHVKRWLDARAQFPDMLHDHCPR